MRRAWVVAAVVSIGAPAEAEGVLDRPAFTAAPADLLAAARAAPAGVSAAVILRDQRDISYDDQGRATSRWRVVVVVRTQAGIEDWGDLAAQWSPSHEDRPVVRARVIDPAGHAAELDPALAAEVPAPEGGSGTFSDRRRLGAPLPRLSIGAVIEQEIVTADREPVFAAGSADLYPIGREVPILSTVISYSAPVTRRLRLVERMLPAGVRPRHEVRAGRERWTYELGALPAQDHHEAGVPGDVVVRPYIGVTTAASWAAVARAYRAVLDRRIAEGPIVLPAELPHTASQGAVRAITAWLHRQVRYTGVELGEASLVPWPPAETVARGFGDCKDQATLLVALLRQAQIRADLVLLDTGPGRDIDPDLPGMGHFDHAIVRARLGATELWIDATEELGRVGQLPARDQGRRALVISDDTRGLVATPAATAADNVVREVRTFVAAEHGPARLTEVSRAGGVFEAERRAWARAAGADKGLDGYADTEYAGTLDHASTSDVADLATPFEETVVIKDAHRVFTTREKLEILLLPQSVLARLPWEVTQQPAVPRAHEFAWARPHIYEIENRVVVPPGFTLPAVPPDRRVALGPATFTERRRIDGQTLIVTFRFESGKPRLTPSELTALQAAVAELNEQTVHITIEHTAFALGYAGEVRSALAECERLITLAALKAQP